VAENEVTPTRDKKRKPPSSDDLALERTRLAHDRTLMAWIRTAFSMISFGFTIFKFFQYLEESKTLEIHGRGTGARNLGVTLIILGTLSLIVATWQHLRYIREMKEMGGTKFSSSLPVLIVAILITIVGLLAVVSAFVHTGIF
jgi:putative membrane protein